MLLVAGGALAAASLTVALVALLRGGDESGSPSVTATGASGSPSSAPPADSPAARARAHALALRVVLAPEDWAPGYRRADPYEQDPASEYEVSKSCQGFTQANRSGTLAAVSRAVTDPRSSLTLTGITDVRVFADTRTAELFLADARDTIHRCPAQQSGTSRWSGVQEATEPTVTGFDEVTAEEGTQTADADGKRTDYPYVAYTGRSGDTVLSVIAYETRADVKSLAPEATAALQKLQRRLASARGGATGS
ncbi:hypothetical protein [Streptomyces showdoensis]|uniref:hypothetical protein n=1 Tax=Streptomyces showdoensis TaxID=68268 RepID=UPI000F4E42DC|nr:hypothetical protein [Streptomyces showdoensis]